MLAADGHVGQEDDRRALLGMYASWQFQYAAFAFVAGAAVFAELTLYFESGFPNPIWHALILATVPPTTCLALMMLKLTRIEADGIVITLAYERPTFETLMRKMREAEEKKVWDSTKEENKIHSNTSGLRALDAYYTVLTRLDVTKSEYGKLAWRALENASIVLVIVYAVAFIVCLV